MWNKSPRWMFVYVHVRPPTRPSSPVFVHARLYGGQAGLSFGVSCESEQPALLTTAFAGVPPHLSSLSGTPSPSESQRPPSHLPPSPPLEPSPVVASLPVPLSGLP